MPAARYTAILQQDNQTLGQHESSDVNDLIARLHVRIEYSRNMRGIIIDNHLGEKIYQCCNNPRYD